MPDALAQISVKMLQFEDRSFEQLSSFVLDGQLSSWKVGCQLNDGSWVKTATWLQAAWHPPAVVDWRSIQVMEDGRVLAALGKRFQAGMGLVCWC